ncbi:hypothetical protein D3C77_292140 [compost metagenome]
MRIGLQACLVATAAEQVVAQLDAGLPVVVVVADLACGVVVGTGGQHCVKARVERRLGHFVLLLGSLHVGLGRFQVGVVVEHALASVGQGGGQFALDGDRCFQLVGLTADDAVEVGFGVGQVHFSGVKVVLCQCPTGGGLVTVGVAAYATFAAQADLVIDAQVSLQVVLGQGDQFAALEHLQVHLDGAQGNAFGSGLGVVGAGVDHRFGTAHLVGGVEAVEQHLPQAQVRLGVGQGFFVVVARTVGIEAAGVGVV